VADTVVIADQQVTEADFRVDLTAITVNGKPQAQFARSLDTHADPDATITLVQPVTLDPAFASGAMIRATVRARLAMHGVSRAVTFPVSAAGTARSCSSRERFRSPSLPGTLPGRPDSDSSARWPTMGWRSSSWS
jgi:hypothetical protein